MKNINVLKKICLLSAASTMVAFSSSANAEGVIAGTDIALSLEVNYNVGGIAQTPATWTDTIKVDRKVAFTVTRLDTASPSVTPGKIGVVAAFKITNTSNDTVDFALSPTNVTNASSYTSFATRTDSFDLSNLKAYAESTTTNNTYDAATDTKTYADQIAPDASITVYVVGDVPLSAEDTKYAGITLTATASAGNTPGALGAVLTASAGANDPKVIDTVFADDLGAASGAKDGKVIQTSDFLVATAVLGSGTISTTIYDPVNGTTNPRDIKGAVIQKCSYAHNKGSVTAAGVVLNPKVDANTLTYLNNNAAYPYKIGVTVTATPSANGKFTYSCNANTGSTIAAPVGSPKLPTAVDLAPGATFGILWHAEIK